MKKFLRMLSMVLLVAVLVVSSVGCDWTPEDVGEIMDGYFEKYQSMNKTESGSYAYFKDINVESSYLGYGYDVINDPYMDKDKINFSAPILDMNKIENAKLKMIKENSSDVTEYESSSIQEFYQKYSTGLNVYGKIGKAFSGGLKVDYSGSNTEKEFWYFYKHIYTIKSFNIYITNTISEIKNMLSEEFKTDLVSMSIDNLFQKYGTHLIKEAVMGGRMEISSTYSSDEKNTNNNLQIAVNTHIKFLKSISINTETSVSNESELSQKNISSNTKIKQFGGALVDTHNKDALSQNYSKWVESFDQQLQYAALCGVVGENSLLGLWDLLPEEYSKRAVEMKNRFIELSGDSYNELCNLFKLKQTQEDEPIDKSWSTITNNMNRENCNEGNKYDPSVKESSADWRSRHDAFELGNLNLYGCSLNGNENYKLKNIDDFSIKYQLLENIDNLPQNSSGVQSAKIVADEAKSVFATNIDSQVGKGAYWIRVTYADDSQEEFNSTNIFENKSKGSYIELLNDDDLNNDKMVEKIEIVVVYEIYTGGPGVLGIWWHETTNWRCEYTYNFA